MRGGPSRARPAFVADANSLCGFSKLQLQSKLQLSGATVGARNFPKCGWLGKIAVGIGKRRRVRRVKNLEPELQCQSFAQREVLEKGRIEVKESRSKIGVAAQVSRALLCRFHARRQGKRFGIEILAERPHRGVTQRGVANQVRAQSRIVLIVPLLDYVVRQSAVSGENSVQLPTTHHILLPALGA